MLSKVAQILSVTLVLCSTAAAGDGSFTLVPKSGRVPFQATCFDDIATAELLTWREFQEKEFENRLKFELALQDEKCALELGSLKIKLNEAVFRYEQQILLRDEEIESLRGIIKKDRKVNLPLAIAGSIAAGIAIGVGTAYAIDKAIQ